MTDSTPIFLNLANVEDENTLTFQIKDTEVAYVNTLRRMILTGVESLAFNSKMNETGKTTDVRIDANTTPMTNEMLADRIGLIPIFIQEQADWNPDGWDKDQFEFRLSVENDSTTTKPVKVEDIEVYKLGTAEEGYMKYAPGNKEFFQRDPVSGDTCVLAMLKAKQPNVAPQKIEFRARASVGTGNQHIRWCPVSQCSYNYTIDTDPAKQQQYFERWLENNKKLSMEALKDEPEKKEAMIREFQTMEVQRCYKTNEKGEPNSFDFIIETIGTLPIFWIVERALYNIEKKCAKYAGELPSDVKVVPADARMKGFDFYFPNEDHTLGNLFQSYMEANLLDAGEISFAGYKVPHPLRAEMVLRIGVDFPTDKARDGKQTIAQAAISRTAAGCALLFRQWREDWVRAKSRPIGIRNRESLRLNVGNAKALEEAAARVAPSVSKVAPEKGKRVPQKSAFYGKLQEKEAAAKVAAEQTSLLASAQNFLEGYMGSSTPNYGQPGQTPPYSSSSSSSSSNANNMTGQAGQTPPYSAVSPNYQGMTGPKTPEFGKAGNSKRNQDEKRLPPGWEIIDTNDGEYYYVNANGKAQWNHPADQAKPQNFRNI